jgi:hypothetical protein
VSAVFHPEGDGVGFGGHSGTTRAEVGFGDEDAFVVAADDARGVVACECMVMGLSPTSLVGVGGDDGGRRRWRG